MSYPRVQKRDGVIEDFDREKLKRVIVAAGCSPAEAEEVALRIEKWIVTLKQDIVLSTEIRDQVLEELKTINTNAANLFAWYEQTKEEPKEEEKPSTT